MEKINDLSGISKDIRGLGVHTRFEVSYNTFRIFYHDTCIIEISQDFLVLDNGGFNTATTKKRMNQVLQYFGFEDARVYTEKKIMIADLGGIILPFLDNKKIKMPLVDGKIPAFFTGVTHGNNPEWINDEINNAIDLGFEEWKKWNQRKDWDAYEPMESDYLIGDWKKVKGLFECSDNGEYSAIFRGDSNVIQVIKSQWYKKDVRFCSPCYPNQADLESGNGGLYAFDLPSDIYGDSDDASDSISFYTERI